MFSGWGRGGAGRKVKPGDGHELQKFRWWQLFSRALFHLRLPDDDGRRLTWSVDVRLWGNSDGEVVARLYRDGRHHAVSKLPAAFPVPGGTIEVKASGYGLRRCHFVAPDGGEYQLAPDPASAEGRRARFDHLHPVASRVVGVLSFATLVVAFLLGAPQILEQITQIPPIAENVGTFTSPIQLPSWLNVTLVVAAIIASTERATRLRYNWLLDGGLFEGDEL